MSAGARAPALVAGLLLLFPGLLRLDAPALWWDEGWTLTVARQLAERDLYGRLLLGEPSSAGLNASYPVTAAVAAIFNVLGIGIWQGRLFGVLCAAVAAAALCALASRLVSHSAAWWTLAVVLLLSGLPQLNMLLLGRQVLGEAPQLAALLLGYLALLAALGGRWWWGVVAAVLFALAIVIKTQTAPFLLVSLLVAGGAAVLARRWRAVAVLAASIPLCYAAYQTWVWLQIAQTGSRSTGDARGTVSGLAEVMGLVLVPANRWYALGIVGTFGLPTLVGLAHGGWRWWLARAAGATPERIVTLALLAFCASWIMWYALLSVGVPRYLFPPVFVAALFLGAALADWTGGAPQRWLPRLFDRAAGWRTRAAAAGALLLLAAFVPLTLLAHARYYLVEDRSAQRVAAYLTANTPAGRAVETYESELHFLLDIPYHFPPDQVHVDLNRRSLLGETVVVDYDPLQANPYFVVTGRYTDARLGNGLYDDLIASGRVQEVLRDGVYTVYRVR